MHTRVGHRQALDHIGYCSRFGTVRLQEFEPGGDAREQVAHLDDRAAVHRLRNDTGFARSIDLDP